MSNKTRDDSLDFIAGFFILYVILYHCLQWAGLQKSLLFELMKYLGFFMPWFFFKGGMFFKPQDAKSALINSSKRLLRPFILWSLIGHCVYMICIFNDPIHIDSLLLNPLKQILKLGSCSGNLPLWFLLSLLGIRVLFNTGYNLKIPVLALSIFGFGIAYSIQLSEIKVPLWLTTIASGLFFYGMGFYFRNIKTSTFMNCLIFILFIVLSIVSRPYVDMRENKLLLGFYWVWPIWSLSGILATNNLFKFLNKFHFNPLRPFIFLGKNTMVYYVAHWPIILLSSFLTKNILKITEPTYFFSITITLESIMIACTVFFFQKLKSRDLPSKNS